MNIQLITMWYNEEFLAPFFLNHYAWVDRIHIILDADTDDNSAAIALSYPNVVLEVFHFPDKMDDIIKSTVLSHKYRSLQDADYVIIVDSDEFIFPWDPAQSVRDHLQQVPRDVYFVNLWQIYKHESEGPLDPARPVYLQRRHGDPDMESPANIGYLKPIVVRCGLNVFWGIGNHYIVHNGEKLEWATRFIGRTWPYRIATERDEMLQGAHWRLVDLDETIRRRIRNRRDRQSTVNLDRGLTAHYHAVTEEAIRREYEEHQHDPVVIGDRHLPIGSGMKHDSDDTRLELVRLYCDEAVRLSGAGDYPAAAALYRKCLLLVPELDEVRLSLAWCLGCRDDFAGAALELRALLRRNPNHHQARQLLGRALARQSRWGEAAAEYEELLRRLPADPEGRTGLAGALYQLQRYDAARTLAEGVLAEQPDHYDALLALASVERTEAPERALDLYGRLAALRPGDHQMRLGHATLLLALGRYAEGWREFEERIPTLQMSPDILAIPRWHGQPLDGRVIVLVAEQGHGDVLQFIRYVPLLAARGARVMVLCHNDQIRPLVATVAGVAWAVIPREPLPAVPEYHCPLMSLPFELGTVLETIPATIPYLFPDPQRQAAWRQRLANLPGRKVGLVWAGNRAQADNDKRSVPFGLLGPLFELPGISFVSLQVGPDALGHQPPLPAKARLIDWTGELHDFRDTAALASCLDLVISICSGVTHLCGGLGLPTWVMLQYDADWRWLRGREDSPWYPTMRLFRQAGPGEWDGPLARLRQALAEWRDEPAAAAGTVSGAAVAAESYQQGVTAFGCGDLQAAEALFRQALAYDPASGDALNGLATVLDLRGDPQQAAELYDRLLELQPDNGLALFNLANTLRKLGRPEEAEALYRRALSVAPEFAPAWAGLGNLLLGRDLLDEAGTVLRRARDLAPGTADVLCDLGVLAGKRGEREEAEALFRDALAADPGHAATLNQLGMLLMWQNRLEEAEELLRRALAAKPDYWLALNNLGVLLHWAGRLTESEECHRRFIAAQPENGTPHFNLALVLFSQGRLAEGWPEYEWRFRKDNPVPLRHTDLPRWQGEPIEGRTILVHAEQGYGDTIQFARYLPLLLERGAAVVLECQDRVIAPLFASMPGLLRVVARGETLPPLDLQIPLMSLPGLLGERACREPVATEYLAVEPGRVAAWRERLAHLPGRLVGLVWSGRRGQDNNHNRMIPPELFARLAGVSGVSFVDLLVGVEDAEADATLACLGRFDARPWLKDFADTAALLACLDLLISVDTATAHLAGALGREAWVMIPYNADWRWTFGLPACPLYPSVRLFRQETPFAWEPVLTAVRCDLFQRVAPPPHDNPIEAARAARDGFDWDAALAAYRRVLERDPADPEALAGAGACLQMKNRPAEALEWYVAAVTRRPDDAVLHCNRGLALLTCGNYPEGWRELQWRKRLIEASLPPIPFLTPERLAEGIVGASLLLHAEQGFGDTIQMLRYIPLLAERGVRVVATLPAPLVRLVAGVPGIERVVPHGATLPVADYQSLMGDLPWLFGTTLETIPRTMPYLVAPADLTDAWRERLGPASGVRIGLAWACGGGSGLNRELRSLPFARIEELVATLPEVRFYSLQLGEAALTSEQSARYPRLHDLTGIIDDFADTAAVIACLDHVVSVDTAVAHLAGALGKPVSLLLPSFREWRWVERNGTALWYPTVRVLDIPDRNGWQHVADHIDGYGGTGQGAAGQANSLDGASCQGEVPCRLCGTSAMLLPARDRCFHICPHCGLIFSDNPLDQAETEQHYCGQHGTGFDFLAYAHKVLAIVRSRVEPARILDFGAGSGELARAFRELGFEVDIYEPMFDGPFDPARYAGPYDLVVANEVLEHVADILATMDLLYAACRPGGAVYIGTLTTDGLVNDPENFRARFDDWWYKDDLTHVSFYNAATFEYICSLSPRYEFMLAGYGPGGALLQRKYGQKVCSDFQ